MTLLAQWYGLRRRLVVDQQLWFMGRDIAAEAGNGLLRYGFARERPTQGHGSSAYVLRGPGPECLVCWGFGLYFGALRGAEEHGAPSPDGWAGLVLTRFDCAPRLVRQPLPPCIHQVTDLPSAVRLRCDETRECGAWYLRHLAERLALYEQWAIEHLGRAHREAALEAAPRHKQLRFHQVAELSSIWERICDPVAA